MNKSNSDFGLVFWVHIVLIAIGYAAPFLFNFNLVFIGVLVIYAHWVILDDCFLTKKQFDNGNGNKDKVSFYKYYLGKVGIKLTKRQAFVFGRYIIPSFIIVVTFIWQIFLDKIPLII